MTVTPEPQAPSRNPSPSIPNPTDRGADSVDPTRSPSGSNSNSRRTGGIPLPLPTSHLPLLSLSDVIQSQRRHEVDHKRPAGHTSRLASSLAMASVKHMLYARGQLDQPIALIQAQANAELNRRNPSDSCAHPAANGNGRTSLGKMAEAGSNKRKRDQLLESVSRLSYHLDSACDALSALPPSSSFTSPISASSSSAKDLNLLLLLGPTLQHPRDLFSISIHRSLSPPIQPTGSETRETRQEGKDPTIIQEKAKRKTQSSLEQKLVRFLINDDRVDEMSSAVAPTKAHILLLAPESFRCQGWIPKRNLKLDLTGFQESKDELSEVQAEVVDQDSQPEPWIEKSQAGDRLPSSLLDSQHVSPFQSKASIEPGSPPSLRSSSPSLVSSDSSQVPLPDRTNSNHLDRQSKIQSSHQQSPSSASTISNSGERGVGSGSEGVDDLDIARMSVILSPLKKRSALPPPRSQSQESPFLGDAGSNEERMNATNEVGDSETSSPKLDGRDQGSQVSKEVEQMKPAELNPNYQGHQFTTPSASSSTQPNPFSSHPTANHDPPSSSKKDPPTQRTSKETLLGSFSFDLPPANANAGTSADPSRESLLERISRRNQTKPGGSLLAQSLIKSQEKARGDRDRAHASLMTKSSTERASRLIKGSRKRKSSPTCSGFVVDFGLKDEQVQLREEGGRDQEQDRVGKQEQSGSDDSREKLQDEELIWFVCETIVPSYSS